MIAPGSRLGVYEILGPLATDGLRPIYAARLAGAAPDDPNYFVVKPLETARDPRWARDAIAELLHETSSYDGAGVLAVRGVFQVGRDVCIVSDLLRGDSLRHLLDAGARPPRMLAVAIARELARILARVHRAELVHGDLCPSTIMVSGDGQLVLRELGVARVTSARSAQHGEVRGHQAYLAPERAAGRTVIGARADIYSLGLVLWELLTGQAALRKKGDGPRVSTALTTEIPPPSTHVKCGRELDAIVMQALSPEPEGRHASADALATELDRYLVSRAPGLDLKTELGTLMSRHLGSKLRAQQLLLDRWTTRRRDPSGSRDLPAGNSSRDLPAGNTSRDLPRTPSSLPRTQLARDLPKAQLSRDLPSPSRDLPSRPPVPLVERTRSRPPTSRPVTPATAPLPPPSANLFSELDLAVQDLGDEAIVIEPPLDDAALWTPGKRGLQGALAAPEARTDDLAHHASSDLPVPTASPHTRSRVTGVLLLFLALAAALATYLFSPEGAGVLDYWLKLLSLG